VKKATALAALLLLTLTGCGGRGEEQVIELDGLKNAFSQPELVVRAGQPVRILFSNKDNEEHDFAVDRISVSGVKSKDGGEHAQHGAGHPSIHVGATPGTTGTLQFTPKAKGTYEFYCSIPGHKDGGMVGKLIVQ
jgi:uncharacterized cupredoxin-like copper-binding protein